MDRLAERIDQLTPLQRAVFALKESQAKLERLERARTEPIAIIGMACRFPGGADNPDAFWELLRRGGSGIREVPPERWNVDDYYDPDPAAQGKTNSRWGGFLGAIDGFDKRFFGISEREAARMDPQQRLIMELAWEAIEDAGIPPSRLAGSRTGVFIGIAGSDYCLFQVGDPTRSDAYAATGTAICIAANRVSFTFDLHGPSLALETACSSSLVAVHQACQSLRSGESTLALVGGVNIMLCPTTVVSLTKAGLSSPDGRCRSFDAGALGYVRGEGAGLVVLKPLDRALADGDPIHAVIRGTAVNQDGQSNGMKTPNRQAQEALLRAAYAQAGVEPAHVGYIEAQGTATLMGDMIEARAIGNVCSDGRPAGSPCLLGSVKTNIGHLETAAGIAGLIKTALVLKHRAIPASLHFETPNPHVPFDELSLRVVTELTPWPKDRRPAVAGVSALGFGGTNAHIVLEEAPHREPAETVRETAEPRADEIVLPLSARHESALRELATALRDRLAGEDAPSLRDVAETLAVHRDHHDHRLSILARSRAEAAARLDAFVRREPDAGIFTGCKPYDRRPRAIFVFAGRAADWRAAAAALRDREPAFQAVIDECDRTIQAAAGWSLSSLLDAGADDPRWHDSRFEAPALVALHAALATLWRHWGVAPSAVVGFDAGEASAAWAAGVLSLADALRVAIAWSRSEHVAADVQPRAAAIPLISSADGRDLDGPTLSAAYWSGRAAHAADVARAIDAARSRAADLVIEIGPPSLADDIVGAVETRWIASLARTAAGAGGLAEALAVVYAAGYAVDWSRARAAAGRFVRLPSYPWQRERCWLDGELAPTGIALVPRFGADPHNAELSEWLYDVTWEPRGSLPLNATVANSQDARRWLILSDASGVGERLAEQLEARGDEVAIVASGWGETELSALSGLGEDPTAWDGIVHLGRLDIPALDAQTGAAIDQAQEAGCGSTLRLIHALGRSPQPGGPRIWLVTRGVHAVAGAPAVSPAQAPLWGLGRTLALEHPRHWGGLIDLDPDDTADAQVAMLLAEITAEQGGEREDQLAYRAGRRHAARLVRRDEPVPPRRAARFRADATYLITGGLGTLARPLAEWMVEQGARRLVLMGRTPLPPRAEWSMIAPESRLGRKIAAVRALEALGASVQLAAVDVTDEPALAAFLDTFRAEGWPPIRGVFHLAGTVEMAPLVDLDPAALAVQCRPKLTGAWLLHRLLSNQPLDEFVLFSTSVGVLGSPLLGAFAAAGAALDGVAEYRRSLGLPATSIGWGAWPSSNAAAVAVRRGIKELTTEQGLELLGRVLDAKPARVVAMPYAADDWVRQPPIPLDASIFRAMDLRRSAARQVQPRPDLKTPYEAPRTELERWMAALWAEILRVDRVGIHDNFFELGGDSLQGAVLLNRIQEHFREILHLLALFETPHIAGLAAYLRKTYPADIRRLCPGEDLGPAEGENAPANRPDFIDRSDLESMELAITARMRRQASTWTLGPKNPRAIFVLSPPRSGSTLLRVMLAGHPRLFVPPELYLLHFNTMTDRKRANEGPDSYRLEGGVRALMEARHCDGATAQEVIRRFEDAGMTTQEYYRLLQQEIGNRIFVDKTPAYAMDLDVLKRAEAMFDEPLYVHLLRHPCGMIRSYDEYRLAQIWTGRFEHPYSPAQLGEMVWVNNHENILAFLDGVPKERQFPLKFEDLVRRPEELMRAVCAFAGLDYHPAMAEPYEDRERKMVDGIAPQSRMLGDQKFTLKHRAIDPSVADRWKEEMTGDFLGPPARALADRLGYGDIAPPRTRPDDHHHNGIPIERIACSDDAGAVLEKLDTLTDDEVDSLLRRALGDAETAHE